MRIPAALLVLTLGAASCTTKTGGMIGTLAGGSLTLIGVIGETGGFGPGGEGDPSDVAWLPLTIGLLIAIPSALVWATAKSEVHAPPPAPKIEDRVKTRTPADREQAWQLTKRAADASRAGDCATVISLGPQVVALDADLYGTVFVKDVGIARCLSGSPAPAD